MGAVLDRTLAALTACGHQVRLSDLYADGFRPELDRDDRAAHLVDHRGAPDRRPDIAAYTDNLAWCDSLILVYPTWWSAQPAMLKGWFDRVLVRGVAWDLPEGANRIRPLLTNVRTIVGVTSHGSSKFVNSIEGEAGKRTLSRSLRAMCGLRCRARWIALYAIDHSTPEQRERFLDRVERRITRL
ncbi:MAG: putative oxidoreductase [Acidimicrobiaceae bacterium]|nr:MAG: putative oxidoreductase [Acidimicrobiaceae bacterium]